MIPPASRLVVAIKTDGSVGYQFLGGYELTLPDPLKTEDKKRRWLDYRRILVASGYTFLARESRQHKIDLEVGSSQLEYVLVFDTPK